MSKKNISCILGIFITLLLVGVDQFTKYLAVSHLKEGNSVIIIKDVFQLRYLENRGAAFGMMQGMKVWFVIGTFLMLAVIIAVYWRCPMEKRYCWARGVMWLLAAGALGNLIDRLRLDYVVDFFYFELINFPIFNVADIYVTCGMAFLMLLVFFYYKEEELERLLTFWKKTENHLGSRL